MFAGLFMLFNVKENGMGKKLKTLAGGLSENQLAQTVKDSAHQIWLAGLGAFAKAHLTMWTNARHILNGERPTNVVNGL